MTFEHPLLAEYAVLGSLLVIVGVAVVVRLLVEYRTCPRCGRRRALQIPPETYGKRIFGMPLSDSPERYYRCRFCGHREERRTFLEWGE